MRYAVSLMSLLLLVGTPSPAMADPILLNGSFELGPDIPTQDIDILAGSADIIGWTVFGASVDYLGPPWDVSDGTRAIDLDGRDAVFSGVRQTFATIFGQSYVVSFDLSGNPHGGSETKLVRVSVGDFTQDYSHNSSGQTREALQWQSITFSFVASGPASTLSFMSLSSTPSSFGPVLDNVSVTTPTASVPEPSTLLVLSAGLAMAFGGRHAAAVSRGRRAG